MKLPFEDHFDRFSAIFAALLKFGIFVGGACIVAYSLRIGRFPQGLSLGDSLLLVMAAICFGAVFSIFTLSLLGLGITLSPLVRATFWIAGKFSTKFAKTVEKSTYTLAPFSWLAALGGLFSAAIIFQLAQRDVSLYWNLPALSIFLYFMYSAFVSSSSQIVELAKVIESPVETSLRHDHRMLHRFSQMKMARWITPLSIVAITLLFSGASGEILDASMRAAKIRIESPTVYIKQPYSTLMPKTLTASGMPVPDGYQVYKHVTVLFNGFGTVTVLAFMDGQRRRTLDVPNEYVIIERE